MSRFLQLVILTVLFPFIVVGQRIVSPKTFVNATLDKEDGVVYYSLCQDRTGMLWLGTNMGLCNYDGYRINRRVSDMPASNTSINCLQLGDSILYAGADAGVLLYDLSNDVYLQPSVTFPTDVRSLAKVGNELWIGSLGGLFCYDISTGKLSDCSSELPHKAVYAIEPSTHGGLYVGTYNGLCRYDNRTHRLTVINLPRPSGKKNLMVNAIADDPGRGCLWVGTEGALYKYDYETNRVSRVDVLDSQEIKSLALDDNGNVVMGTNNGLFIYSEHRIEYYRHDSRIASSLSNNIVWSVMVDRDGNIWAGTEAGLSEWVNGGGFSTFSLYQITGSSEGSRIYSIFRDSRGYLWLGGTNGLIRRSPTGHVKWYKVESDVSPLVHNRVRCIYEDSRFDLWVATDGGINRYDYITEQFVHYDLTDSSGSYNANWAYGIAEDHHGRMWVGAYLGGLFAVSRDSLRASGGNCVADLNYNKNNLLPNNMINQIAMSRSGILWASLYKSGSVVRVPDRGKPSVIDVCDDASIQYIVPDSRPDGGLWCGYHNGLAHVVTGDTVRSRFTFPTALDIDVYAMCMVGKELWTSTSQGVWVMDLESEEMRHLRLPAKLYTSIYFDRASHRILLGGYEELTVVEPDIVSRPDDPREIMVTSVFVNDKPYMPKDGLDSLDVLELEHDQSRITLEFADFDYRIDNRKSFQYRIEGVTDKWVSLPPDDNRIVLPEMRPGEYKLEIRSLDAVSDAMVLNIKIRSAWYASWWAVTLYILLGVAFVLWVLNFLWLKIKLRMERVRSEKTLEMVNSRMEFLTNISHELKTPLSMIIGPLSKMINEEKNPETRRHLDAIQQNALKLNALIHRALEVNRMDANPDNMLIYSQVEMVSFCRSIFDIYREGFPSKQLIYNCSDDRILVKADAVKMESVINNLLSNACKYSGDNAIIELSLSRRGDDVVIVVKDNGVGIPHDELPLVFQRLYQSSATKGNKEGTGIGLYLVKNYVEMHHGTITVDSEEGRGSTFTVTLPVGEVNDEYEPDGMVQDAGSGKLKVLIVEDNVAIASFIREVLKERYNCSIARDGKQGLKMCDSLKPDLIIADMMMPVMDGMEMCRRIKRNNRLASIPIILLTAKDDRFTEAESIKVGIDAFMSKPFEADMLLGRVEQLLKSKEIMRSNLRVEDITVVKDEAMESAGEKTLAEVTQVIESNIADPDMNVSYVCDKTGLSSKQLYRLLKNYIGTTPSDYIRQIRMKKAAMLLQQRKFTVSEVMYMVGFSSTSYFSKCFAAQFGCTPREYADKTV